jgi:glycosyltransferase involved in cell wall biosynthesis
MSSTEKPVRVLYSFPHKLGAARICTTAWHQVDGVAKTGADVTVYTGSICREFDRKITVHTTLAWGKLRLPARLLGTRKMCALHDRLVARKLKHLVGQIDVIHAWPLGALRTLNEAKRLGIPTVLERPNAHTRYAYEIVKKECEKLGISMPPGHEHDYNPEILAHEEAEYELADYLLCPSDFVARTFLERGFPVSKLLRHQYGFNEKQFHPDPNARAQHKGLTVLFAGGCAPRKGLHNALDAWLQSSAHTEGTFLIAGGFIPGYAERLAKQLAHPSVKVLGHRNDIPELMRKSDILVLPSIEEGSALVTSEARGSGCVLLVSDAAGAICQPNIDGLVHHAGDVGTLTQHFELLASDRTRLESLRTNSLATVGQLTWEHAGKILNRHYHQVKHTS